MADATVVSWCKMTKTALKTVEERYLVVLSGGLSCAMAGLQMQEAGAQEDADSGVWSGFGAGLEPGAELRGLQPISFCLSLTEGYQ